MGRLYICLHENHIKINDKMKANIPKDPDMSQERDFPYNPILGMGLRPSILL